jgi:tetratricopeptide (TPR) repeat protein
LILGNRVHYLAFTPDEHRLVTASVRDKAARVWELTALSGSERELERLAVPIGSARFDPARFASERPSRADLLAWHESEASAAAEARNWEAALGHYEAMIRAAPADYTFPVLRARARLEQGDRVGARDDLLAAVRLGSDDCYAWNAAAILAAATGERAAYRALCRDLVGQFGGSGIVPYQDAIATICTLAPGATADPARIESLAEGLVRRDPTASYYLVTLGAAHYRAGDLDAAVARLHQAIEAHQAGGTFDAWLFLALCCRRLGREREAQAWISRVERYLSGELPYPVNSQFWAALDPVLIEVLRGEFVALSVSVSGLDKQPITPTEAPDCLKE